MAISIEEALLAKAAQDEQDRISPGSSTALGAGLGALTGATAGAVPHAAGLQINKLKDRLAAGQGLVPAPNTGMRGIRNAVRPGTRFAGGLVGAILGGGLGAGARQAMMENSPAATLLAKIQMGEELTQVEKSMLQNELASTYSNITQGAA
jgi:hypothetical protein